MITARNALAFLWEFIKGAFYSLALLALAYYLLGRR